MTRKKFLCGALAAGVAPTIVLRLVADPGPANQTASDWSGWGDVVIE